MKGIVGVDYTPKEVSKQVVAGMNYRFRCEARVAIPDSELFTATVEIYQPLQGSPTVTRITRTSWAAQEAVLPGGWTPFRPVDAETMAVFVLATKDLVGVGYTPLQVSTQVVAGMNYRYICDARIVYPGVEATKALVEIYQPPGGKPHITRIEMI